MALVLVLAGGVVAVAVAVAARGLRGRSSSASGCSSGSRTSADRAEGPDGARGGGAGPARAGAGRRRGRSTSWSAAERQSDRGARRHPGWTRRSVRRRWRGGATLRGRGAQQRRGRWPTTWRGWSCPDERAARGRGAVAGGRGAAARGCGCRTAVVVPLRARGRVIGAVNAAFGPSGRRHADGRPALRAAAGRADRARARQRRPVRRARAGRVPPRRPHARRGGDDPGRARQPRLRQRGRRGSLGFARRRSCSRRRRARSPARSTPSTRTARRCGSRSCPGARRAAPASRAGAAARARRREARPARSAGAWSRRRRCRARAASRGCAVTVIEDVTEVKRAELAERFLAQAGAVLASALDYEQTLRRSRELAVPRLADWCSVTLPAGDRLRSVAVAHADPAKVAFARGLSGALSDAARRARPAPRRCCATARRSLINEIDDELLAATRRDAEQRAAARRSACARGDGRADGRGGQRDRRASASCPPSPRRTFDAGGPRARRGARPPRRHRGRERAAVRRALDIAATLQRGLLPDELPRIAGMRLASLYRPAGEENMVGGDFYDAFPTAVGWMLLVGDVDRARRGGGGADRLGAPHAAHRGQLLGDPARGARAAQPRAARSARS